MIQNGLAQLRGCVSVAYTDTPLLLRFRVTQLFSSALNRVANQFSNVLRCSFQIANLGDRTGQGDSFRQLLEEGFNQCFPLLEGEALGYGDKLVNGHCVYSLAIAMSSTLTSNSLKPSLMRSAVVRVQPILCCTRSWTKLVDTWRC